MCIETMQFTGIRSVFMRTFQDFGDEYNVPACYIESVDQAIRELERLRSTYISNDMLSIWTGPDVTWATTKRGYEKILEYCLDRDMRYTMHLKETLEDDDMCQRHYGTGIVELLDRIGFLTDRFLAVHCVNLTEQETELLAGKGVSISHNPAANLYLGSGIAPIPAYLAAGGNVTLGTDGAASNNMTDMIDTMRLTALIHKGFARDATAMSAEKVVKMSAPLRFRKCKNMDEIIALAEESDRVLSDEELDFIASGGCYDSCDSDDCASDCYDCGDS